MLAIFGCTSTYCGTSEKAIYHGASSDNVTIISKRSGPVIWPSLIVMKFKVYRSGTKNVNILLRDLVVLPS